MKKDDQMSENYPIDFDAIYAEYIERFKKSFGLFLPLIKNNKDSYGGGFNEVNQTAAFLAAAEKLYGFGEVYPWYELAIPNEITGKNGDRIDDFLLSKKYRFILFVESKRYEGDPENKMNQSIDDANRLQKVASDSSLLRQWLKFSSDEELKEYRIFGLILGAIWPSNKSNRTTKKTKVYDAWKKGKAFDGLKGKYFGVQERILIQNKTIDDEWSFYLPGFLWEMDERRKTIIKDENARIVNHILNLLDAI